MTRPAKLVIAALASAATLAIGCATESEDPCYRNPASCAEGGERQTYVVTNLSFPESLAESRTVGMDLDGDDEVDNDLGTLLPGLKSAADFDLAKILNDAMAQGEVILLVELTATDMNSAQNALGRVVIGKNPSIAPCADETDTTCGRHLAGGASFEVDNDAIFDAAVLGDIDDSRLSGGPNAIKIEIDLEEIADVPAFILNGEGVRASARQTSTGIEGVLAGGVRASEIENAILPALVQTAHDTCQPHEDPAICCVPGTVGASLIKQFDQSPFDCRLTTDELKANNLVASMLAPTVDLLDGNSFGSDGELESLSLGARFEAVPADF